MGVPGGIGREPPRGVAVLVLGCSAMVHYVACERVKLRDAAGGEVYGAEQEAGDTGSRGSCLVLMRMSDAAAALGALGMRVHGSYSVAHRHVEGVVRRGQRDFVRVTGGREVPVSRSRVASVRMAMPPGGLELTSVRS